MTDREDNLARRTRSGIDRHYLWVAASRPPWSIRSRRGSVAPFVALIRSWFRAGG